MATEIRETAIERLSTDNYCTLYAGEKWSRNLAKKWLEEHPDEVTVIKESEDYLTIRVPAKVIKYIRWPTKRACTDEQREAMKERAKKARNVKKGKLEVNDEVDEELDEMDEVDGDMDELEDDMDEVDMDEVDEEE